MALQRRQLAQTSRSASVRVGAIASTAAELQAASCLLEKPSTTSSKQHVNKPKEQLKGASRVCFYIVVYSKVALKLKCCITQIHVHAQQASSHILHSVPHCSSKLCNLCTGSLPKCLLLLLHVQHASCSTLYALSLAVRRAGSPP